MNKHSTYLVIQFVAFLFIGAGLGACTTPNSNDSTTSNSLEGRILLWHSWPEEDAAVLQTLIDTFQRVHPNVIVVVAHIPADQLRQRFEDAAALGLGPDVVIGSSDWFKSFTEKNIISPIDPDQLDYGRYLPAALELTLKDQILYGAPLNIQAPALYYNPHLIEVIPQTYEELLTQSEQGHAVALSTNAYTAFMGIQAFGDALVPSELSFAAEIEAPSGLIAWLEWLKSAQEAPNIILSQDEAVLARLFMDEKVSFYIASFEEGKQFREVLMGSNGENGLGITTLPSGPFGLSRPLIKAEVLYLNVASSRRQHSLALALVDFLTNVEQNNTLLRELGHVPANQRVRVGARVYPDVYPFLQSGRAATTLPKEVESIVTGEPGNAVYTAVLSGVKEPEAAACELNQHILQATQGVGLDLILCSSDGGE